MTLRQEMLNGFGMAHGGMIFAFGDTAFALACNPAKPKPGEATIDPGTITVASGVDINFLKPAFRGQVLTAVANRRASTGRSGLYDIQIYAADPVEGAAAPLQSELVAEFRGRSRTISKK
jgi:acyl-CoA thioesterase